jgi:hypothetical protein
VIPAAASTVNLKRVVSSSAALMVKVAPPRYEELSVLCGWPLRQDEPLQRKSCTPSRSHKMTAASALRFSYRRQVLARTGGELVDEAFRRPQ